MNKIEVGRMFGNVVYEIDGTNYISFIKIKEMLQKEGRLLIEKKIGPITVRKPGQFDLNHDTEPCYTVVLFEFEGIQYMKFDDLVRILELKDYIDSPDGSRTYIREVK